MSDQYKPLTLGEQLDEVQAAISKLVKTNIAGYKVGEQEEPIIITKTEYKEVLTPIKCVDKMPTKPNNDNSKEAAKALIVYLKTCEEILKECVNGR